MTTRITQKDLDAVVSRINRVTQSPDTYSTEIYSTEDTAVKHKINIGHYHISYAYGGVSLVRTCNEGGGVRTVSFGGHTTKRALYMQMQAYLAGLEDATIKNPGGQYG
jgi:hypothetical protein